MTGSIKHFHQKRERESKIKNILYRKFKESFLRTRDQELIST